MRRRQPLCVFLVSLVFAVARAQAQNVRPNPDPGITGEGYVDYVGRYGEVLKLRGGWDIEPSMHGDVEVINYHPSTRIDLTDSIAPFHPQAADYAPENFSRYGLIQFIVSPLRGPATEALARLRQEKEKDLQRTGVDFRIVNDPWTCYGCLADHWPAGSFEVLIGAPYRLTQLYTTTSANLCILTSGVDTPPASVIKSKYDSARTALGEWALPKPNLTDRGPAAAENEKAPGISHRLLAARPVWVGWLMISGLSFLLAGLSTLTKRLEPVRKASLYLVGFAHGGAAIGALIGLLFRPFAWSSFHLPAPIAIASLFMPFPALLIARLTGAPAKRAATTTLRACSVVASLAFAYIGLASNWGPGMSPHLVSLTACVMFVVFGIGGAVFGFIDGLPNGAGAAHLPAILLLILLARSRASAQSNTIPIEKSVPNTIEGDIDFIARSRLSAKGITEKRFESTARENLQKNGVLYDFQRVEIKGIWSKEDTADHLPGVFDKQIEPSHINDKDDSTLLPTPKWLQTIVNYSADLYELQKDANQHITETAARTVQELQGKEVNEIVAHSWGTEILYNAILEGKIAPPRKIIVAGMPDRDLDKWTALSKYTGTQVVIYTDSHDPAAGAARLAGNMRQSASISAGVEYGIYDSGEILLRNHLPDFEAQWQTACRQHACNPHGRVAENPIIRDDYTGATHNRLAYYQSMIEHHDLPNRSLNRNHPGADSAWGLQDAQTNRIRAEQIRLFGVAMDSERQNVALEATHAGGEIAFLQGLEHLSTVTKNARDTFDAQEAAAKAAWEKDPNTSLIAPTWPRRSDSSTRPAPARTRRSNSRKLSENLVGTTCANDGTICAR